MVQTKYFLSAAAFSMAIEAATVQPHTYTDADHQLANQLKPLVDDMAATAKTIHSNAKANGAPDLSKSNYFDANGHVNVDKVANEMATAIRDADGYLKLMGFARRSEMGDMMGSMNLVDLDGTLNLPDVESDFSMFSKRSTEAPSHDDLVKGLKPFLMIGADTAKVLPKYDSLDAATLDKVYYLNRAVEGKFDAEMSKDYPVTDTSKKFAGEIDPLFRYSRDVTAKFISRYTDASGKNLDVQKAADDFANVYALTKSFAANQNKKTAKRSDNIVMDTVNKVVRRAEQLLKRELSTNQVSEIVKPVISKAFTLYSKTNAKFTDANGQFQYDAALSKIGVGMEQWEKLVADVQAGKAQFP